MMKKRLCLLFIFAFLICTFRVNAESNYLIKDYGIRDGYTYNDAINWTNINEVDDGYIISTLSSNGYGVLRKIDKKDGSIIWENYNDYGIFFADVHIYKDFIYAISFDFDYGTCLIKYDKNGNYVDELELDSRLNNQYVYGGETFLHGSNLYFVYKSQYNAGVSDTIWGARIYFKY